MLEVCQSKYCLCEIGTLLIDANGVHIPDRMHRRLCGPGKKSAQINWLLSLEGIDLRNCPEAMDLLDYARQLVQTDAIQVKVKKVKPSGCGLCCDRVSLVNIIRGVDRYLALSPDDAAERMTICRDCGRYGEVSLWPWLPKATWRLMICYLRKLPGLRKRIRPPVDLPELKPGRIKVCRRCSCSLALKTRVKEEQCPLKKWPV